jgi:hypothetical protein
VAAVDQVNRVPDRKVMHLRTRIVHPGRESDEIRAVVVDLLDSSGKQTIDTVVNTLFPVELAARCTDPQMLARRYRAMYGTIRSESPSNLRGTYFGRLVAHPTADGPVDQFNRVIEQLARDAARERNPPSAIYEGTVVMPGEICAEDDVAGLDKEFEMRLYAPKPDTIPRGFPCLSHLSFQRDHGRLHLMATYRSQYLIARGYGNFLALGLLQRYIAEHAGLEVGELTVDTGLAAVDVGQKLVTAHLDRLNQTALL